MLPFQGVYDTLTNHCVVMTLICLWVSLHCGEHEQQGELLLCPATELLLTEFS